MCFFSSFCNIIKARTDPFIITRHGKAKEGAQKVNLWVFSWLVFNLVNWIIICFFVLWVPLSFIHHSPGPDTKRVKSEEAEVVSSDQGEDLAPEGVVTKSHDVRTSCDDTKSRDETERVLETQLSREFEDIPLSQSDDLDRFVRYFWVKKSNGKLKFVPKTNTSRVD